MGLQIEIEQRDPELAAVLKGQMPAELELDVLNGEWAFEAPAVKSAAQMKEEAIAAAFAAMGPAKGIEQLEAEQRQRMAEQAHAQRNSYVAAHGRWE